MQETKAANPVHNLRQHLRQQHMQLSSRSHDCESSRNIQVHLLADLRDRERAHQETLIRMTPELEELRKVRCSEAKNCVKKHIWRQSPKIMETLWPLGCGRARPLSIGSRSKKELQDVVSSLNESQDVKALETARSSKQQLQQQYMEQATGSQDCESSRHEQLQLLAELRSREQARRMPQEVEELGKVRSRKMIGIIWRQT